MSEAPPALPAPIRIITGHSETGQSTVVTEGPVQFSSLVQSSSSTAHDPPATRMSIPWEAILPSALTGSEDLGQTGPREFVYKPTETRMSIIDTPPGGSSPMHRTLSLDYGVCLSGEMTMLLEDGSERVLKTGDIVVQRGTLHKWHNRTNEWSRMIFVCCGAEEPLIVNGQELKTEFRT